MAQELFIYIDEGETISFDRYDIKPSGSIDNRDTGVSKPASFQEIYTFLGKIRDLDNVNFITRDDVYTLSDIEKIRYMTRKRMQKDAKYYRKVLAKLALLPGQERERIEYFLLNARSPEMMAEEAYLLPKIERKKIDRLMRKMYTPPTRIDYRFVSPRVTKSFPLLEESIANVLKGGEDKYGEFIDLWNDRINYGALPATMIYLGYQEGVPVKALQRIWIDWKQKVLSSGNDIYETYKSFSKEFDYAYCSKKYNFLVEFYEKGLCNCECGSYMVFMMSKIIHSPPLLYVTLPRHSAILTQITGVFKKFETTAKDEHFSDIDINNIELAIGSEQILALQMILLSQISRTQSADRKDILYKLLKEMLDIDTTLDLKEALRNADRTPVRSLLDSNTFDIISGAVYCYLKGIGMLSLFKTLNKEYVTGDIEVFFGLRRSEETLEERMISFSEKLQKVYDDTRGVKN